MNPAQRFRLREILTNNDPKEVTVAKSKPIKACAVCSRPFAAKRNSSVACGRSCGRKMARRAMSEVFWDFVSIRTKEECWPWIGAINVDGYGRRGNPSIYAHRYSWEFHNGRTLTAGECVLHSCDNPTCVNPAHLSVGTKADNNRDRASKGRGRDQRGERHNMVKLTPAHVIEIRQAEGSQTNIGEQYGISQGHVSAIKRGASWAHLLDPNRPTTRIESQQ